MSCVCLFQSVLLFRKFCFHGAICLMGDIKFSFQLLLQVLPAGAWFTSSGCSSSDLLAESHSPGPALRWFHQEGPLDSGLARLVARSPLQPPSPLLFSSSLPLSGSAFRSGSVSVVMSGPTYVRWAPLWGDAGILILLGLAGFCTENPMFQDTLIPGQTGKVGQPGVA